MLKSVKTACMYSCSFFLVVSPLTALSCTHTVDSDQTHSPTKKKAWLDIETKTLYMILRFTGELNSTMSQCERYMHDQTAIYSYYYQFILCLLFSPGCAIGRELKFSIAKQITVRVEAARSPLSTRTED